MAFSGFPIRFLRARLKAPRVCGHKPSISGNLPQTNNCDRLFCSKNKTKNKKKAMIPGRRQIPVGRRASGMFLLAVLSTAACFSSYNAVVVEAFQNNRRLPSNRILPAARSHRNPLVFLSPTDTTSQEASSTTTSEAAKLRAEASKLRIEAEKLDEALTASKMEALERKLNNKRWVEKHPEEEADLQKELRDLSNKRMSTSTSTTTTTISSARPTLTAVTTNGGVAKENSPRTAGGGGNKKKDYSPTHWSPQGGATGGTVWGAVNDDNDKSSTIEAEEKIATRQQTVTAQEETIRTESSSSSSSTTTATEKLPQTPLAGFDDADLALYLPVARAIEEEASRNGTTLSEQVLAFQQEPSLQDHFQKKIQTMLMGPMEDMMQLEEYKKDYLMSRSSVEKEQLKREIDKLEKQIEQDGPFTYSDGVYLSDLPILTQEELKQREEAVGALPLVLQAIYKARIGLDEESDLRLAIQIDYYEAQIQLLEQIKYIPFTDDVKKQAYQGFRSLPRPVQQHVAKNLGVLSEENIGTIDDAAIVELVVDKFAEGRVKYGSVDISDGDDDDDDAEWLTLQEAIAKMGGSTASSSNNPSSDADYYDIEFVDRSRYLDEFIPSLAGLEMIHPSQSDIDAFISEVLNDRKAFVWTSKPERVLGGYYIRGENKLLLPNENDNDLPDNDALVQRLQTKLAQSSMKDRLDVFYIQDPSPPTDEEIEMDDTYKPVLAVVTKNRDELYRTLAPPMKTAVSLLGICSVFIFAISVNELQPNFQDRIQSIGDDTGELWRVLVQATVPIAVPILVTQILHELGHRVFAWKDKFEVGFPNVVPSIQLGLQGAITPLRSPPPNLKSLFDFSIAGPLVGLLASVFFLGEGLVLTSQMSPAEVAQLPALPLYVLKASSLGGGMIEYFLGKGALSSYSAATTTTAVNSVLCLHPFAIAGFVGAMANALALLPLGHTDGGRIAVSMFGRRGAFLVQSFTALILCAVGLFGLDESRILLCYVLFATIWQRGLETPMLNEADELDFGRGVVAILSAVVVFLVLVPMS